MDPVLHLLLPILFLLAIRIDPKKVLMFAPLAIIPDFDAAFGLHRAVLHSFVPILVVPIAFIIYSKLKRPDWMLGALLAQFFLASHVVLDLGGVAFLWPFVKDQFYFEPELQFNLAGGVNFIFHLSYGLRPFQPMTTTDFVSDNGFAVIFLGILLGVVFRNEGKAALARVWLFVKGFVRWIRQA